MLSDRLQRRSIAEQHPPAYHRWLYTQPQKAERTLGDNHLGNGQGENYDYVDRLAISAINGSEVRKLVEQIKDRLPASPPFYPKEEASDLPMRFFVSELIREQLFMLYQQEVPYSCAVNIISYKEEPQLNRIHAEIVVNRQSQKGIIIGKKGIRLKELGIQARKQIEAFINKQVHLELFVKVREKWRDNENYLKSYGYR